MYISVLFYLYFYFVLQHVSSFLDSRLTLVYKRTLFLTLLNTLFLLETPYKFFAQFFCTSTLKTAGLYDVKSFFNILADSILK